MLVNEWKGILDFRNLGTYCIVWMFFFVHSVKNAYTWIFSEYLPIIPRSHLKEGMHILICLKYVQMIMYICVYVQRTFIES